MPSTAQDLSVGKLNFAQRHELWNDQQKAAAERIAADLEKQDINQVRISWGDQHGILRGKTIMKSDFLKALHNGQDFQGAVLIMDTTNNIFVPLFVPGGGFGVPEMTGYPDTILVPDPTTFRVLPWAEKTGWVLADMYFENGKPVPFCTRQIMRSQLDDLRQLGYEYLAGLEVEFYITKVDDPMLAAEHSGAPPEPPRVSTVAHGYQYLTENRNDEIDDILQVLQRNLRDLGLPLRSMEDEWGPGQCEFTFDPQPGMDAADTMLLFRSATKQICRRHGLHASFMTRPALPNFFSSGWHLHQSLLDTTEANVFTPPAEATTPLSAPGRFFVGGLLEHAAAATMFTTPTINGYKRFKPNSFAPNKATWALENRGAMLRVIGGPGDPTSHIENRVGEPCANPHLYMASQIAAGFDGITRQLDPGGLDEEPYNADRPTLPANLSEATAELEKSRLYREKFGDAFIDYMLMMKRHEWNRFLSYVTDWEHKEYFENF